MKRMHDKYPTDDEVKSFYALAILGTSHGGRDFSIYMRAAALVEQVYAKNPQHPGAAHYLIHAYDDPVHAPLGLRYADAYSKIAPSASHALHMPSHIYVAMGMWDEAAAINERSVKAADARREAKKLDVDQRGFHALLWLVYALHAAGPLRRRARRPRADGSRREGKRIGADAQPPRARARRVADRDAASGARRRRRSIAKGLPKDAAIAELFAIGFAGVALRQSRGGRQRDAADGGADGRSAGQRRAGASDAASAGRGPGIAPIAPGRAPFRAPAPRPDRTQAPQAPRHAAPHGASAAMGLPTAGARRPARAAGDGAAARGGAPVRRGHGAKRPSSSPARPPSSRPALPFEFGPPVPVKPVNEQVGEMLMDLRRPKEAMEAFELSLKRTPRRTLSLLGLARAAMAAKDIATAQRAYGELRDIWKKADKTLPELKEARRLVPPPSSY